jgi:hypothetical protein
MLNKFVSVKAMVATLGDIGPKGAVLTKPVEVSYGQASELRCGFAG